LGWSWRYERHEVASGGLERFLGDHQGEFRGLSLTMPLKEEAVALLTDASDLAKRISAVNTIVFDELGAHGFNTDVQGFVDALSHHGIVIPVEGFDSWGRGYCSSGDSGCRRESRQDRGLLPFETSCASFGQCGE